MSESHEHSDHPDFKFVVEVEFTGVKNPDEPWNYENELHALIYTDGHIAVTLHECCYATWFLGNGELHGGSLWKPSQWKLTKQSLDRVRNVVYVPDNRHHV